MKDERSLREFILHPDGFILRLRPLRLCASAFKIHHNQAYCSSGGTMVTSCLIFSAS